MPPAKVLMTGETILQHVRARLANFVAVADPVPISGGLMNYVWRVPGQPQNIVVKYAPPYIAALPDVTLDPVRIVFEARSLEAFSSGGVLAAMAHRDARPPFLLDVDVEKHILIQEDVGHAPDLGQWLQQESSTVQQGSYLGELIGQFIGTLHRQTFLNENCQQTFNNITIQQARLRGQYARIREYLERGGVPDAEGLGLRALELGYQLLKPGLCLTMGDLWPPAVLITESGLRIIDWEFAHFGRPAQDVGHLAAHLWMHQHCAASTQAARLSRAVLDNFLASYRRALDDRFEPLFGKDGLRESAIHFGAEVLARTVGTYQPGYLYDNLLPESPAVQEAVHLAAAHIRLPEAAATFTALAQ